MNDLSITHIDFSNILSKPNKISSILINDDASFIKVLNQYNLNISNIAQCKQTHSSNVKYVISSGKYLNTDGLVTSLDSNLLLQINTADCIPIFMYDPLCEIMGIVHSGWRGTNKEIILNALNIFYKKGSKAKNIKIVLGPSIRKCCFEVKEDVSSLFNNKYVINSKNKLYVDLILKILDDLKMRDIKKNNIFISEICTFENMNYHSYRRDGKKAGRMISIIGKKV